MAMTSIAATQCLRPYGLPAADSSVHSNIVQTLREAILSGALKPGDKLSDARLCDDLRISRSSLREALRYALAMLLRESNDNLKFIPALREFGLAA